MNQKKKKKLNKNSFKNPIIVKTSLISETMLNQGIKHEYKKS